MLERIFFNLRLYNCYGYNCYLDLQRESISIVRVCSPIDFQKLQRAFCVVLSKTRCNCKTDVMQTSSSQLNQLQLSCDKASVKIRKLLRVFLCLEKNSFETKRFGKFKLEKSLNFPVNTGSTV